MELFQYIESLKLTRYEKEIIIFLSTVVDSDAKTIYKKTKVPKGRIYSVLTELHFKGFVDIIPSTPKRYIIKDVKAAIKGYLKNQAVDIEKKSMLVDEIELKPKELQDTTTPEVSFYTSRDQHLAAVIKLRESANIEMLQLAPRFKGSYTSRKSLISTLDRGVKVRIIIKAVTAENKDQIKTCTKHGAKVRVLKDIQWFALLIKDNKEFLMTLHNRERKEEIMGLVSQNPAVLGAMRDVFNKLWQKAKPIR